MKKICLFLFLISLLAIAALINSFYFATGQASKEVRGIIDSDIIWSKSNSPYTLTAPLSVNNGITLTIEPGVTINLNSYYIQVNGTLVAKGTSANLIQFNGDGAIKFTEASKSWNEHSGVGCIIENTNVSLVYIQINDASPKINLSFFDFGIGIDGGSPIISNNIIQTFGMGSVIDVAKGSPLIFGNDFSTKRLNDLGNPDTDCGISMENASNAQILNNTFDNFAFASINAGTSTAIIENNSMMDGIKDGAQLVIRNNTLGGSIVHPSSSSTIVNNNILSGGIELTGSGDVNAPYNWWGTTDTSEIDRRITDFNDDFNLGKVKYTPFLTEANPQAMPDSNAAIATPTITVDPSVSPNSTPDISSSPSQNPTSTSSQPVSGGSVLFGLDLIGIVIVALLGLVVVLLVFVVFYLRKRR